MTEESDIDEKGPSLIDNYKKAASQQRIASLTLTLFAILTVLGFVFLIWSEVTAFREEGIEVFTATLEQEATEFLPEVSEEFNDMLARLAPVYVDSFTSVLERDETLYRDTLIQEYAAMEAHAQQEAWPKIEKALAQLVADQESALHAALHNDLNREQLHELSDAYRIALQDYINTMYAEEFAQQDALGEEIISKLRMIADSETVDLSDDTRYLLGVLVELLGLEIQKAQLAKASVN